MALHRRIQTRGARLQGTQGPAGNPQDNPAPSTRATGQNRAAGTGPRCRDYLLPGGLLSTYLILITMGFGFTPFLFSSSGSCPAHVVREDQSVDETPSCRVYSLHPAPFLVGKVIEPGTIIPQILALGRIRQIELQKRVHGVRVFRIRVRVIGGEHHRVAEAGIVDVFRRPLIALDRGKALALKVIAGLQGQLGMFEALPLLCSSIRHISHGTHEQFPSRNATRRWGNRSRIPPPQKLTVASIIPMEWEQV